MTRLLFASLAALALTATISQGPAWAGHHRGCSSCGGCESSCSDCGGESACGEGAGCGTVVKTIYVPE
jgi:hypothetical protein